MIISLYDTPSVSTDKTYMKFISAKCPNCGAELQVAENLKTGFCNHCGSKILFEPAVSNVKIDQKKSLSNYKELAESALRGGDWKNALKYAEKALEIDAHDADMWLTKLQALIQLEAKDSNIMEVSTKVIHYADGKPSIITEVNELLLEVASKNFYDSIENSPFKDIEDNLKNRVLSFVQLIDKQLLLDIPEQKDQEEELAEKWKKHVFEEGYYNWGDDIHNFYKEGYLSITTLPRKEALEKWNTELEEKLKIDEETELRKEKIRKINKLIGIAIDIICYGAAIVVIALLIMAIRALVT